MVGHLKFKIIILASFIIFGESLQYEQIFAIALILIGTLTSTGTFSF